MTENWKQWQGMVVDGTFPLDKYLGGSDHSAVYLTEWGPYGQRAAIKLTAADEHAEMYFSRWKLAAQSSHPNLLRLHQAGRCELDGVRLLYVVMEHADEDLSEVLLQRPLSPGEARVMLSGVLDALAYLHGQGLVHGHLKPANVMAVGNQLKISIDGVGPTGSHHGCTSFYDPPEAARGVRCSSGDVWALGVTMVEALTQRLPTGERTLDGLPVLVDSLAEPFRQIAERCLALDPQCRGTVATIQASLSPRGGDFRRPEAPKPLTGLVAPKVSAEGISGASRVPRMGTALALGLLSATMIAFFTMHHPGSKGNLNQALNGTGRQEQIREAAVVIPDNPLPEEQTSAAQESAASQPEAVSAPLTGAVVPGTVIERALPRVPRNASRTIRGRVRVKVKVAVDPTGRVQAATLSSRVTSDYFADVAVDTARHWRFTPAQLNGQNVASEWILGFEFRRAGTKIFPIPMVAAEQP